MLAGAVTTGAAVSSIVTFWVPLVLLPLASVAVHVTSVVPTGYVTGASLLMVTAKISVAVA